LENNFGLMDQEKKGAGRNRRPPKASFRLMAQGAGYGPDHLVELVVARLVLGLEGLGN
jgi:hypothetical protein